MSSTLTPPITLLTTNHLALMLRSLRKRKGWTQADLAKRLNVSQQAVSRMEVNTDNLSWARLHHVLNVLDAKVSVVTDEYLEATRPQTEW